MGTLKVERKRITPAERLREHDERIAALEAKLEAARTARRVFVTETKQRAAELLAQVNGERE
jgi:hypothetical protein